MTVTTAIWLLIGSIIPFLPVIICGIIGVTDWGKRCAWLKVWEQRIVGLCFGISMSFVVVGLILAWCSIP